MRFGKKMFDINKFKKKYAYINNVSIFSSLTTVK